MHVLIIVQNLPVPLDRRVWLECRALRASGYDVSVICPKGDGDAAREVIDGVHLYKYSPPPNARSLAGFAFEFIYCWIWTAMLSLVVYRRQAFHAIQACNPPDTYWLLARLWRWRGVNFVFDQHDLNPELFQSRFGEPTTLSQRIQHGGLLWLEKMTYRSADGVIATNESYRRLAIERGGCDPDTVTVVRSGPDTKAMRPVHPVHDETHGGGHRLAYLGIMGPQDGVHLVLEVMDEIVNRRGRTDVSAVLMGFGDCLQDLQVQCRQLGLDDWVTFTGRVTPPEITHWLSSSSIGLCPDLKTPLNDLSTMNKTMEYMAYALPSVAFDLVETRVSGEDSVIYVPSGDVSAFAEAVIALVDDAELRGQMGLRARRRVEEKLDWRPQSESYVGVFDRLFGRTPKPPLDERALHATIELDGTTRHYVNVGDERELLEFAITRGRQAVNGHQKNVKLGARSMDDSQSRSDAC